MPISDVPFPATSQIKTLSRHVSYKTQHQKKKKKKHTKFHNMDKASKPPLHLETQKRKMKDEAPCVEAVVTAAFRIW